VNQRTILVAVMNDAELTPGIAIFVDSRSKKETAVIAMIHEREFSWAQVAVPDLAGYLAYDDWLDNREGFQFGLAIAGVEARMVSIALQPFLAWCRLTRTLPSEGSLDSFASMVSLLRTPPEAAVMAVVRRPEFENYVGDIDAFAAHPDFEHWSRHRETVRSELAALRHRVEELPVRVDDFVSWTQCVSESTSAASMDQYATLLLEYLLEDC
jgi:hypothetical protein